MRSSAAYSGSAPGTVDGAEKERNRKSFLHCPFSAGPGSVVRGPVDVRALVDP